MRPRAGGAAPRAVEHRPQTTNFDKRTTQCIITRVEVLCSVQFRLFHEKFSDPIKHTEQGAKLNNNVRAVTYGRPRPCCTTCCSHRIRLVRYAAALAYIIRGTQKDSFRYPRANKAGGHGQLRLEEAGAAETNVSGPPSPSADCSVRDPNTVDRRPLAAPRQRPLGAVLPRAQSSRPFTCVSDGGSLPHTHVLPLHRQQATDGVCRRRLEALH